MQVIHIWSTSTKIIVQKWLIKYVLLSSPYVDALCKENRQRNMPYVLQSSPMKIRGFEREPLKFWEIVQVYSLFEHDIFCMINIRYEIITMQVWYFPGFIRYI